MSGIEEIMKLIKSIKEIEVRLTKAGLDINHLEETVAKLEAMSDAEQRKTIGRNYAKFKKLTHWQRDKEPTKQKLTTK
jgi:hypothetical protein